MVKIMNVEVNSNGVNKSIKYNILSDEETRGGTALQHRALACCQEISQGDLRYGEIQAAIQQPCISFLA